ncbi:MAG: AAA family ATPase [Clostridia bacterium]|nr:AAA family ATPase [Clostridia bacterium]MBR3553018.1 AAA family ATPase [Clostridia bacterium]
MELTKIVITGGPCAGKTTAMSRIQKTLTALGYTVLFVPETATELITGGVAPWTCGTNRDYQLCHLKLQLEKEAVFAAAAATMPAEKVLLVCDRGAPDCRAYMDDETFSGVLADLGTNEVALRDRYDAVFHLVTAAKGAAQYYTTENNTARTESPQAAAALDDRLIAAWTGHPHLRVIDNAGDFENKLQRLIKEITSFLGEPEPLEIERKFLIAYPDQEWLRSLPNCRRIEIIQTYLCADGDDEVRVRQRGADGHYVYFQTVKRRITDLKRIEVECRLSQEEYLRLLMRADPERRPIRKDRYCLTYENQYFEIDVYPFWNDQAILEIELSDANAPITFPPQLHVLREVTDDPAYKNAALAGRTS